MKIFTVIGARPQFIKASVVSKAIAKNSALTEVILHTGQHFDKNMSDIFFNQLEIPKPDHLLDINGGTHGNMTGRMLIEIEKALLEEKPDVLMVYGDTNSTLAGALAAAKLHIPVAHIEAGLRSFNMQMPEEVNRILTDQVSASLFCPTQTAVNNLMAEGFADKSAKIHLVGDVMQDSALYFAQFAEKPTGAYTLPNEFFLATLHRAENTDDESRLKNLIGALNHIHKHTMPVVLPLHPRTQKIIKDLGLKLEVITLEPLGYLQMLWLLKNTSLVLTDSGGLQKEAFFFAKPCVTLRDQTEWVELVDAGANILAGADFDRILSATANLQNKKISDPNQIYGGGTASEKIATLLE